MDALPKTLKPYSALLADFYRLPKSEDSKYFLALKKGLSFTDDLMPDGGQKGRPCQTDYNADTIADAVQRLKAVKTCDCTACLNKNGRCFL